MTSVKKIKVALLALVAALVIAIPTSAFADTITINGDKEGHTYEAYQVFKGDLSGDKLSNLEWGDSVDGPALLTALKAAGIVGNDVTTPQGAAEAIGNAVESDSADAAKLAEIIGANIATKGSTAYATSSADGKTYTITVDKSGYYLVKDKDGTVSGTDAYTDFILRVAGTASAEPKGEVPGVDKYVNEDGTENEINPANLTEDTDWGKAADYEIGQVIPYKLVGTLPSNYADYKQYYYEFSDEFSAGLTYNNDAKVTLNTVDGTSLDTYFESSFDAGKLTVKVKEAYKADGYLKAIADLTKDSKIVVTYTATLNDAAVIGRPGNPNSVKLIFSNNPNQDKGGTPDKGETPKKWCVVFTYQADQTKVDGSKTTDNALAGAKFALYKKEGGVDKYMCIVDGKVVWSEASTDNEGNFVLPTGAVEKQSAADGSFSFVGLDEGTYYLKETVTPEGFNTVADVEFVINSTVAYAGEYNGPVLDQNGKDTGADSVLTALKITSTVAGQTTNSDGDAEAGTVAQTIKNMPGSPLPSTGGIGTTIFTIVGIALIVAAAAIMVIRRRNAAAIQ